MELTIDTASPLASVALTDRSRLVQESTWSAARGHAAELLPAIEALLARAHVARDQIAAVFVNRGPGGYAGLRVGLSTALGLVFASGADLLGYGRLEADAYPYLPLGRPVCAVHDAARDEFAWSLYEERDGAPHELLPPRIGAAHLLVEDLPAEPIVVGEINAELAEQIRTARPAAVLIAGAAAARRAGTAAELAWRRYAAGARDSHLALTPIYLREPHISQRRQDRRDAPARP